MLLYLPAFLALHKPSEDVRRLFDRVTYEKRRGSSQKKQRLGNQFEFDERNVLGLNSTHPDKNI